MQRQFVTSSNIKSIGFENGILEVGFLNGTVYQYYNVPESTYRGLMSASSHGEYLDAHVKKAGYPYQKL